MEAKVPQNYDAKVCCGLAAAAASGRPTQPVANTGFGKRVSSGSGTEVSCTGVQASVQTAEEAADPVQIIQQ